MARLCNAPITEADMTEYLKGESDFGFELEVLRNLRENDVQCDHAGHYEDPVTNKMREFDIRAQYQDEGCKVRMAIECKNLRDNFPLLVACTPRRPEESYHEIVKSIPRNIASPSGVPITNIVVSRREAPASMIYRPGDEVGKSTVQVGKDKEGNISTGDGEIFEKWGQCLGSANDLFHEIVHDAGSERYELFTAVFPILVVPDGKLWRVRYDNEGKIYDGPEQVDRCTYYIGKRYDFQQRLDWHAYSVSHMEIVTLRGLRQFLLDYVLNGSSADTLF